MNRVKNVFKRLLNRQVIDFAKVYAGYIEIHPTVFFGGNFRLQIDELPAKPRVMVRIGEGSQIFANITLTNENASLSIGCDSQIGASEIVVSSKIDIGDDVLIAWGVTLIDSNHHSIDWNLRRNDVRNSGKSLRDSQGSKIAMYHDWAEVTKKPIYIENKCWIGLNTIVLPGVRIGEGSVIGAGSVVRTSIKDWSLAYGNPCVFQDSITMNSESIYEKDKN
jgi:acetyltransferase-like isoleucine patch superfamily enzyme